MRARIFGMAVAALALAGVAQAADNIPAAAVTEADQIWTTRCALCHGAGGKGDGPAAAPLNPKPRDLGDKKWQSSVDDKHIELVIVKGGQAVNLSPMMAANPDLESKPDVVKALRAKVRSLGGK
ncbi:MAG: c-type cytochrome [Deltaproteobacteria bacterium]|nr:c-type cytochrome [Deltaproteobacteria bacterium]